MSTFYDTARSFYEQENYDPDYTESEKCEDCNKKRENCVCPDTTPELVATACQDCGIIYDEEYAGNYDETPHRCGSCRMKWRGESDRILF